MKIKFGTDGWRAIIAKEYTVDNLKRVAAGTAIWMKNQGMTKAVIGHDTRFAGDLFAQVAAGTLANHGIHVYFAKGFVSTPMISLGVVKHQADMGIVITASHNPPSYSGFKLKSAYGGPTIPKDIAAVEDCIPDDIPGDPMSLAEMEQKGLLTYTDLEEMYIAHVREHFDLELMQNGPFGLAYDAMYGAGQNVIRRLFKDALLIHCDYNPSFKGQAPEPIHRNLGELSAFMKEHDNFHLGLANDGDADRIGLYDEDGNFVDSHHILMLLLYYLHEVKGMDGKVIITFSVTNKMKQLAEHYGLDVDITKIGFKYIAEIMTQEDVIVGGEESGGLAVKGHIPERDGIWIGLTILEFMAKSGKSLKALIQELYDKVGSFACDRDDLHIDNERKMAIVAAAKAGKITKLGDRVITETEHLDGTKMTIDQDHWVMIRPSGTEPVLRVYAQAPTLEATRALLDDTHKTLESLV